MSCVSDCKCSSSSSSSSSSCHKCKKTCDKCKKHGCNGGCEKKKNHHEARYYKSRHGYAKKNHGRYAKPSHPAGYSKAAPVKDAKEGHHLAKSSKKIRGKNLTISKKNEFQVMVDGKEGHPWERDITTTDKCFSIDGHKGGTVYVKRGEDYYFDVKQNYKSVEGHETNKEKNHLYFTSDHSGGKTLIGGHSKPLPGSPDPISHGRVKLHIGRDCPDVFYYQSAEHKFMGGTIVVR